MICEGCGKDEMSYTALGITTPLPHNCPADLVPCRRDELAALRNLMAVVREWRYTPSFDRDAKFIAIGVALDELHSIRAKKAVR